MNKTELENAIKNGESVWVVFNQYSYENDSVKEIDWMKVEGVELHNNYFQYFNGENLCGHYYELIFKTKAEAEHYLHHANVERVEKLPFLTWEEFKEGKELRFYNGKYRYKMNWAVDPEIIVIKRYLDFDIDEFIFNERLTEANFYKAYDECVRLFRGGE